MNIKPAITKIKECIIPKICPFCGRELIIKEPDISKRTTLEDLRCLCCNEIACWCSCGNIYFPKSNNSSKNLDLTCPICKEKPLNH